MLNNIMVISAKMGAGKTRYIKNMINDIYKNNPFTEKRFLFITPYLKHIEDKENNTGIIFECLNANFKQPKNLGEGKLDNLNQLIINNDNIASTHVLFKYINNETFELLKINEYIIIIDEVLQTTENYEITGADYKLLIDNKTIMVNDKKEIVWLDKDYNGLFNELKRLCLNGLVVENFEREQYIKGEKEIIQLLVWNFNPKVFQELKEVYILTYLFTASYMYLYFQLYHINFDKYSLCNNQLVKWNDNIVNDNDMNSIKSLINIYDGKYNNIGSGSALSKNWFSNSKNKNKVKQLKNNVYNYLRDVDKDNKLWTTFKSAYNKLKGMGYTTNFLQCAEKGSNEFGHVHYIAYCCNKYFHPDDKIYFNTRDINVNEDIWALSEMIQFIWRSAIRNGESINVYIPAERMRKLLGKWLDGKVKVF